VAVDYAHETTCAAPCICHHLGQRGTLIIAYGLELLGLICARGFDQGAQALHTLDRHRGWQAAWEKLLFAELQSLHHLAALPRP
jgi:hypothetical protein